MAEPSLLVQRIRITPLVVCDIIQGKTGARASVYPVDARAYFHTHQSIDLTEREVRLILEAVEAANQERKP